MSDGPRAVVERPDSVTHFVCPSAQIDTGDPDVTHHIVHERCQWCGKSSAELRLEVGL
ncbi:hypothetical protein SEA_ALUMINUMJESUS_89 [Microbacterium phage AluminumJesus]|nr:hypothetical protein SEA_ALUMINUMJESUS_89 [Microbacterium phage AluminumJesus]UVG34460.1 hypothetical protein SEA_GAZEBO_91 [Microbacterium phage Gazebo]